MWQRHRVSRTSRWCQRPRGSDCLSSPRRYFSREERMMKCACEDKGLASFPRHIPTLTAARMWVIDRRRQSCQQKTNGNSASLANSRSKYCPFFTLDWVDKSEICIYRAQSRTASLNPPPIPHPPINSKKFVLLFCSDVEHHAVTLLVLRLRGDAGSSWAEISIFVDVVTLLLLLGYCLLFISSDSRRHVSSKSTYGGCEQINRMFVVSHVWMLSNTWRVKLRLLDLSCVIFQGSMRISRHGRWRTTGGTCGSLSTGKKTSTASWWARPRETRAVGSAPVSGSALKASVRKMYGGFCVPNVRPSLCSYLLIHWQHNNNSSNGFPCSTSWKYLQWILKWGAYFGMNKLKVSTKPAFWNGPLLWIYGQKKHMWRKLKW